MLIWAFAGMLIVFVMHIWMDFVWLGGIAFLASKSTQIMSNRNYKALMIGLNMMLIYFGITFLQDIRILTAIKDFYFRFTIVVEQMNSFNKYFTKFRIMRLFIRINITNY